MSSLAITVIYICCQPSLRGREGGSRWRRRHAISMSSAVTLLLHGHGHCSSDISHPISISRLSFCLLNFVPNLYLYLLLIKAPVVILLKPLLNFVYTRQPAPYYLMHLIVSKSPFGFTKSNGLNSMFCLTHVPPLQNQRDQDIINDILKHGNDNFETSVIAKNQCMQSL